MDFNRPLRNTMLHHDGCVGVVSTITLLEGLTDINQPLLDGCVGVASTITLLEGVMDINQPLLGNDVMYGSCRSHKERMHH